MKVLLTNDDGFESPLYLQLAKLLKAQDWVSELRLVAPYREQSWIGTAISKHTPVKVEKILHEDLEIFSVYGTPGDSATIGSFNLFDNPPDLVISGINFGSNAGSAFCFSSGTLGAARQAAFLGIPAIACSAQLDSEIFIAWRERNFNLLEANQSSINDLAAHHLSFINRTLAENYFKDEKIQIYYVSINSCKHITDNQLHLAVVKDTNYIPFFELVEDGSYLHKFKGFGESKIQNKASEYPTDIDLLGEGKNTITLFSLNPGGIILNEIEKLVL